MKKLVFILLFLLILVGCNPVAVQYDITFETGDETQNTIIQTDGKSIVSMPDDPIQTGFVFIGWFWDEEGENPFYPTELVENPIDHDISIYAFWVEEEPNSYIVTFDAMGGRGVTPKTVLENELLPLPTTNKTGYELAGWYRSSDEGLTLTEEWDFSNDLVTRAMTLYAKWEIQSYTVSYDVNGGSAVSNQTAEYGAALSYPQEPTKEGNRFGGWYQDEDLQILFEFDTMPANDITLYAKWIPELSGTELYQEIVKLVTYSFYHQKSQIQYDQGSGKRMVDMKPEDATAENILFADCSSFANSVYQAAFGINATPTTTFTNASTYYYMNFAKLNLGINDEVIYYIENATITSPTAQAALLTDIWEDLLPGDLVVYRHTSDTKGHVMVYVGDDLFLHSTGSDYDYTTQKDRWEANGTVLQLAAADLFTNTLSSRYLFRSAVNKIAVLRPINRIGISPTASALSRYEFPGIDIEKYSSENQYGAVSAGEELTYYIRIVNKGNTTLTNIAVKDYLSSYLSFTSYSHQATVSGNEISYLISSLLPDQEIILEYGGWVTADTSAIGEQIVSNQTMIENIPANPLTTTIVAVDETEIENFQQIIEAKNGNTYSDPLAFIKNVYQEFTQITQLTNTVSSISSLSSLYQSADATDVISGRDYNTNVSYNRNLRPRVLMESYFEVGDILILYASSTYTVYLYTGDEFYYISSSKVTSLSTAYQKATLLDSALSYSVYKIIRPLKSSIPTT
ncbi:MAG: InlB B-repeat-containing protein [Bacilli bacterium]|jgi:uncharacterized repeat protein (TIGR01451 family)/uncharacterized repeat protein (TIGR02543 family)|nr:InlB B-repeat-containing protein [Bacilli bacterium]